MMKRLALRPVFLVLTASLLAVAACGDDDEDASAAATTAGDTGAATTAAEPKSGGSVTFLHTFEGASLDAAAIQGSMNGDGPQASAIYDNLFLVDTDTTRPVPRVAESLDSTDALVWTLKVRPNVRFSDGTPYDADAVRFNWQRMADPATRSPSIASASTIASMDVVDSTTLRITLKSPNGSFPSIVARGMSFIGSPMAIQAKGAQFGSAPVGAGPFVVKEFVRDSQLVLVRNPTYWDAPRPYLDEVIIKRISDNEQRYNTFITGAAQMASGGSQVGAAYAARAEDAGYQVVVTRQCCGGTPLIFNQTRPPFNDVRLRRAVIRAIDLETVNDTLTDGKGDIPKALLDEPSPYYDPTMALPTHDRAEGQRLFNEVAAATGGPVEFTLTGTPNNRQAIELFQAQLSTYDNVRVGFNLIESSQAPSTYAQKTYDAAGFGLPAFSVEPDIYDFYHSRGGRNVTGYANPEMDRALDAGRATLNEAERGAAYRRVQELALEAANELWYTKSHAYTLLGKTMRDVKVWSHGPLWFDIWMDS